MIGTNISIIWKFNLNRFDFLKVSEMCICESNMISGFGVHTIPWLWVRRLINVTFNLIDAMRKVGRILKHFYKLLNVFIYELIIVLPIILMSRVNTITFFSLLQNAIVIASDDVIWCCALLNQGGKSCLEQHSSIMWFILSQKVHCLP